MKEIFSAVIEWHKKNRISLPWREDPTPYHVWLSEIMLQQTRIEAVIPYYKRFLAELPTVDALSQCNDDKLMKLWQGLGYYSRAKNLKKAAILVMQKYGGELPFEKKELLTLPGIGDYTAGAISSIAYFQGEPAVDGNVLRVYMRLTEGEGDVNDLSVRKRVCEILKKDYPTGMHSRLLTEGIMELGERVCIPNGEARCKECPLAGYCLAYKHQTIALYPVKTQKIARKRVKKIVLLLRFEDRFALVKRKDEGLLAGLYEFPCIEEEHSSTAVEEWLTTRKIKGEIKQYVGEAKHIFTHLEWEMKGYLVECKEKSPLFFWHTKEEIERDIPIPTAYAFFKKQL